MVLFIKIVMFHVPCRKLNGIECEVSRSSSCSVPQACLEDGLNICLVRSTPRSVASKGLGKVQAITYRRIAVMGICLQPVGLTRFTAPHELGFALPAISTAAGCKLPRPWSLTHLPFVEHNTPLIVLYAARDAARVSLASMLLGEEETAHSGVLFSHP